ncbi:DNA-directed RNA polymerase subunit beta, partial [Acidobacteriota bacterium]
MAINNLKPLRERVDFSKIRTQIQIPNLIEVQKKSYERFLQMYSFPDERKDFGLQAVFKSIFPISDYRETSELEFDEYAIGTWECKCGNHRGLEHLRGVCTRCQSQVTAAKMGNEVITCPSCGASNPVKPKLCELCGDPVSLRMKYSVQECQDRGMTYAAPLKVTIKLKVYEKDEQTGQKSVRSVMQQEVYFGDIPLMTNDGTFVINGTERVIVSQLHRSPGVFFHTASGKTFFIAQVIPYRGSWVEFEYDAKNLIYVRIDRKRRFLA